jgi:endonuclease/exonuclease/phosphatase family metal-dependent hydrolase
MKLTTWNIEHLARPIADLTVPDNLERLKRISLEILEIDPDILCILEAPPNPLDIQKWLDLPIPSGGLNGLYKVIMIPGTEAIIKANPNNPRKAIQQLYAMEGTDSTGSQWIWFICKTSIVQAFAPTIQEPAIWYGLTGQKNWPVNHWGNLKPQKGGHWRHPQTLVLSIGSYKVEIIGVHLKSKINKKKYLDSSGELARDYIEEGLRSRVKLATEAYDVRMYIEKRFQQEANPYIIVCGDLNDGPGREFFERQYLFFDLVSNIQGEVLFASRFLNHALFDFKEDLRWSSEFHDRFEIWAQNEFPNYNLPVLPVDPTRKQLIDHILFTQAFVDKVSPGPKVKANAGLIEHTIHEKINASQPKKFGTSDHRPVSVRITMDNMVD